MKSESSRRRPAGSRRARGGDQETIFKIDDLNQGDWRKALGLRESGDVFDEGTSETLPTGRDRSRSRPRNAIPQRVPQRGPKRTGKRNVGSEPGEKEAVGLRIIGGRFRGSKLVYVGDNRVRPMKDRVREAVFNLIGPAVKGKHVVDLFAGTGALAIEAISRGAIGGTLIEMHFPTARNAKDNLRSLELESICRLIVSDAFYWSHQRDGLPADVPWIVFCSPPYSFYVDRADGMIAMLDRLRLAAPPGSLFVIEADERFDFAAMPVPVHEKARRSYPPAEIAIFHVE